MTPLDFCPAGHVCNNMRQTPEAGGLPLAGLEELKDDNKLGIRKMVSAEGYQQHLPSPLLPPSLNM